MVVLVGASMVAGIYFWFGRPSPPQADVDRPNPAGGYSALDVSVKEAEIHPRRDNGYPAPAVPNHDREILLDDERYAVVFAEGDLDEETKDLIVQDLRRTFGRAKINDIIPSAIHDDYFQLRLSYVPSDWPGEITISKEENTLLINDDVTTKEEHKFTYEFYILVLVSLGLISTIAGFS